MSNDTNTWKIAMLKTGGHAANVLAVLSYVVSAVAIVLMAYLSSHVVTVNTSEIVETKEALDSAVEQSFQRQDDMLRILREIREKQNEDDKE